MSDAATAVYDQDTMGNDYNTSWNTGTATVDVNSKESVRKQVKDQLRNLFEKERESDDDMGQCEGMPKSPGENLIDNLSEEDKLERSGRIYVFKEISSGIMSADSIDDIRNILTTVTDRIKQMEAMLSDERVEDDDLYIALAHARHMEEVARQKMHHLRDESVIKKHESDPQMINKLKLSHRLAENKALMNADMNYLKGTFDE